MDHPVLILIRAAEYVVLFGGMVLIMALAKRLFEKEKH
jgi:hypothetical protein